MIVLNALACLVPTTIGGLALTSILLVTGYAFAVCFYNYALHPLRRFPGPFFGRICPWPHIIHSHRGDLITWTIAQHEKYGECVRLLPDELSFSGANAYKDIYGFKTNVHRTLEKDLKFYIGDRKDTHNIINADAESHSRMRRIFSHAFSDRALKLQEPLFLTYIDKLVEKLRERCHKNGGPENMVQLLNFTTFDLMADLTFGESLGMLDDTSYHPWVSALVAGFRFGVYLHIMRRLPPLETVLLKCFMPQSIKDKMALHQEFSVQRVDRRIEKGDGKPDIWGLVLEKEVAEGLSRQEMYANADVFMIAGTETTATLLSGLTWLLLANPDKLQKLVHEIRSSLKSEKDITIDRLQALPYLHACIEEGLRMYPPVPQLLPRVTSAGPPTMIDGREVPAGSTVGVTNLAAFRNPNNFRRPYDFVPERWLPNTPEGELYRNDKKHAFQPFLLGPRACLGKNMAYHEMRLILTKLLYNFEIELCEESRSWINQKIFIMWHKQPLMCNIRARSEESEMKT